MIATSLTYKKKKKEGRGQRSPLGLTPMNFFCTLDYADFN